MPCHAQALLECGGANGLVRCVYADDDDTLMLACGALQNTLIDPAWAVAAHSYGVVPRLVELLPHVDPAVVRSALRDRAAAALCRAWRRV